MNRFSSNMLLTAALACASCTAWAQTRVVAAVPFDFRIPGSHLDAGTYEIRPTPLSGGYAVTFRNVETHHSVLAYARQDLAGRPGDLGADPMLNFRCSDAGCWLAQVVTGYGRNACALPKPPEAKPVKSEVTTVAIRGNLPNTAR